MSAIYGVVSTGDRPVAGDDIAAMRESIAYWGPDGGGTWNDGSASLGQLIAHRTPESIHEQRPRIVAGGTVAVAAAGRLDNRDELCAALGVAHRGRPATPDGDLVARAYERWGSDAVSRLLGDWAFAAYHLRERRLFLARDHYGQTALYYHLGPASFAFASSLKALLALPQVPRRLNELRLAQHLVVWPVDGAATLYEGIYRLPPAHHLTLAAGSTRVARYWRLEDSPEVRLPSDEAYVERFLELYSAAVTARLRSPGPVASTLSSGLDSGSVTALAARSLRADDRPLTAFTARPAYPAVADALPDAVVDEWPAASGVAALHPNIEHREIRGEHLSVVQALERSLWIHEEVAYGAANLPWMLAILEAAQARDCRVLLTGQLGNGGVSWAGDHAHAFRQLAAGDLPAALRSVAARRATTGESWPRAFARACLVPLRARLVSELVLRGLLAYPNVANSVIRDDFAARLDLAGRMRASGFDPAGGRSSLGERRLAYLLPDVHPVGALWHENGSAYDLDVRDPTADVRVLEYCLGLPDEQFRRDGADRWLMRRALEGLVPADVQWGRSRGVQWADVVYRLRADAKPVEEVVAAISNSDAAHFIDALKLRRHWERVLHAPVPTALAVAGTLAQALLMGIFLLRFVGGDEARRAAGVGQ